MADFKFVSSKHGANITKENIEALNGKIKNYVLNKNGIYHIVKGSDLNISVPMVYRCISEGILMTKKTNLPYASACNKKKET